MVADGIGRRMYYLARTLVYSSNDSPGGKANALTLPGSLNNGKPSRETNYATPENLNREDSPAPEARPRTIATSPTSVPS